MSEDEKNEVNPINLATEVETMIEKLERCLNSFQRGDKESGLSGLDQVREQLVSRSEKISGISEGEKGDIQQNLKEAHDHIAWVIDQIKTSDRDCGSG